MTGPRRSLALLVATLTAVALGLAPAVSAQSPSPGPTCGLVTLEEVAAALDSPDAELLFGGGVSYCAFVGTRTLTIGVRPEIGLDAYRASESAPDGGAAVTVDGYPAWWWPDSTFLAVDADGRILVLGSSEGPSPEQLLAELGSLASLAIPRLAAGPDADAVARLERLLPTMLGDERVTVEITPGEVFLGSVQAAHPEAARAITDALASAGRTPADLLIAIGRLDSGDAALVALQVAGVDASTLLLPLGLGLFPAALDGDTMELGGKDVRLIAVGPAVFAYASGDMLFYAIDVGAPLDAFFAGLP